MVQRPEIQGIQAMKAKIKDLLAGIVRGLLWSLAIVLGPPL
jgi:hypothetical protein